MDIKCCHLLEFQTAQLQESMSISYSDVEIDQHIARPQPT